MRLWISPRILVRHRGDDRVDLDFLAARTVLAALPKSAEAEWASCALVIFSHSNPATLSMAATSSTTRSGLAHAQAALLGLTASGADLAGFDHVGISLD
jgi:hypothetical protein